VARRGFEALFEAGDDGGSDAANESLHSGVAAGIAKVPDLAHQPLGAQLGQRLDALPKVILVGRGDALLGRPRLVDRWLQPLLDVFAHRLPVVAGASRDGRQAEALAVKVKNHSKFPKCDHRALPP